MKKIIQKRYSLLGAFFGKQQEPRIYTLCYEAKNIFYDYVNKVDAETKNKNNPQLLISYLIKSKAVVARIVLILHCLNSKEDLELSAAIFPESFQKYLILPLA